jgi:hypothetical protein
MNPQFCNHKWDGPTITDGNSACSTCSWCKISYFDYVNGIIPKEKKATITHQVYHFWVGKRTGYAISSSKDSPHKKGEKLKYMGFSSDSGWPKKMNTGRMMHKPKHKKKLAKSLHN